MVRAGSCPTQLGAGHQPKRTEQEEDVKRQSRVVVPLILMVVLSACGGGSESPQAGDPTSTTGGQTANPTTTTTESGSGPTQPGGPSGGTALLTYGNEIIEFDFFTCFYGEEAAEQAGNDRNSFIGYGQTSIGGATATVTVGTFDAGFGDSTSVHYRPTPDFEDRWESTSFDTTEFDGNEIRSEGELARYSGFTETDERTFYYFEATCG